MKVETLDWIDKAEGDWKVAKREIQAPDPVWNVICFLAQQCAEKYVKAFLEEHNVRFRRIHDLVVLVDSTKGLLPELESYKRKLAKLSVFGLAARYPGTKANRQSADDSIKTAEHVRCCDSGQRVDLHPHTIRLMDCRITRRPESRQ